MFGHDTIDNAMSAASITRGTPRGMTFVNETKQSNVPSDGCGKTQGKWRAAQQTEVLMPPGPDIQCYSSAQAYVHSSHQMRAAKEQRGRNYAPWQESMNDTP